MRLSLSLLFVSVHLVFFIHRFSLFYLSPLLGHCLRLLSHSLYFCLSLPLTLFLFLTLSLSLSPSLFPSFFCSWAPISSCLISPVERRRLFFSLLLFSVSDLSKRLVSIEICMHIRSIWVKVFFFTSTENKADETLDLLTLSLCA